MNYGNLSPRQIDYCALKLLGMVAAPPARPIKSGHTHPTWREMVDAMEADYCRAALKAVLRARRRFFEVSIPTCRWAVKRAELRDYLRQRDRPHWMRDRPMPDASGETIRFRRHVPFKQPTRHLEGKEMEGKNG